MSSNLPDLRKKIALSYTETAAAVGVSVRTIKRLVANGVLPVSRIGERSPRIPLAGLVAYLERQTAWPTAFVPAVPGGRELMASCAAIVGASGAGAAVGAVNRPVQHAADHPTDPSP